MLKELLEAWEDFEPRGRNYFQNGPQVSALRVRFMTPSTETWKPDVLHRRADLHVTDVRQG